MARITYVWDKDKMELIEASEYYAYKAKERWKNNHMVITDSIDPFLSHADKKKYDSKSKYRKTLKALGYEEVGNDKIDPYKVKREAWEKSHKEYMNNFRKSLYDQL